MTASYEQQSFNPDQLFADPAPSISRKVTIASGTLVKGTVLGKITVAATAPVGAAVAGNTGNGTIDSVALGATVAKAGVYRITCIEPATDLGTFSVEDPDGIEIGVAVVGTPFVGPVNFTLADGSTDFVAGDAFTVTVAAGTGQFVTSLPAGTNGSQIPEAVLAHDADASAAPVEALAYFNGAFNERALTIGTGHTAASIRDGLRAKGIHLVASQGA